MAVAVLALAGCGRAGDRASVRSVAESFYAAVRAHDGARACAWLSAGARQALEQDQSSSCARAIVHLKLSGGGARRVEVYSTNAAVALRGGNVVYLETTPRGWRISAVGCRNPAYATPASCEAQS
ncbi:MAG TPA: hypothetical protein VF087_02820 [Solirubrobacteraceae bacterium]